MSNNKRLIGLLHIAVLCSQGLCAQTRQMSIEELFRLADEQSKSIQTYRTGAEAAEEALKAAKAQRLPDVNVSLSASYWGNGKLWDRDFGNAMTVDMPHFGNNFALEAQQAIYAGGAISSGIKQAEVGKALAELDLQKNVQEIRFLLVGHYLDVYKLDNQIRVLQKNMELTEEVIANMKAAGSKARFSKTTSHVMNCKGSSWTCSCQEWKTRVKSPTTSWLPPCICPRERK